MPRDYYIKINLFKYLSVMNQPLNHLVEKSANQSIKHLWLTVLPMRITNGPVTTSDLIWCTDYDSLNVTTPHRDGSKSCGLICFWFDH